MKTVNRNNAVTHYRQLTKEQLIHLFNIKSDESEIEYLIQVFLYLNGLKIDGAVQSAADTLNGEVRELSELKEVNELREMGEAMDVVDDLLHYRKVGLRNADGNLFLCDVEHLIVAARAGTEWLQKDHTLVALPFDRLRIGKHWYKMPDALMINTTYQQYSNAQGYMMRYWNELSKLSVEMSATDEKSTTVEGLKGQPSEALSTPQPLNPSTLQRINDARAGFLASMLCPYRWVVKKRWPFIFKEPMWSSDAEAEMIEDMKSAPEWLFEVVYKQWQDNINQFRRKFPELFHEVKTESKKHDAFVAELGIINLVISEGGYPNAAAVYEENVVFVLKLLNDKQKEYKEMEKVNYI